MEWKNLKHILGDLDEDIIKTATKALSQNIFSGKLIASLESNIKTSGKKITINFSFDKVGEFLDKGTKPHFPPIKSIEPWADAKGIPVWALAKSISEKGTKAHPWINSVEELIESYVSKIQKATTKDIQIEIKKHIK